MKRGIRWEFTFQARLDTLYTVTLAAAWIGSG